MIPSDHFVKFYNEIFKFLEKKGPEHLERYYERVAERQAFFTLEAFKRDGFKGMYDYWERIRIEENCELTHEHGADFYHLRMEKCPSLTKVLDNDASPCLGYCDHCPGWIGRVLAWAGYFLVYDIIDRVQPQCEFWVFQTQQAAEAKCAECIASHGRGAVRTNFNLVGKNPAKEPEEHEHVPD